MNNTEPKKLSTVTLVAISSDKINESIHALKESMRQITFHEVILISHQKPENLPDNITFKHCEIIDSIEKYNKFMLFDLDKYITSEFALTVQYDGYVINSDLWSEEFLKYDYIGAPWNDYSYFLKDGRNIRVGNGGFSLRSKKLLSIFNDTNFTSREDPINTKHEDYLICVHYREILETYGIKFPPTEIASIFSKEEELKDSVVKTFGFHIYKNSFLIKIKSVIKKIFSILNLTFLTRRFTNK